jgi:hypothetical protein
MANYVWSALGKSGKTMSWDLTAGNPTGGRAIRFTAGYTDLEWMAEAIIPAFDSRFFEGLPRCGTAREELFRQPTRKLGTAGLRSDPVRCVRTRECLRKVFQP